MTLNYLAYGSNLHPLRLLERVPSASLIGFVDLKGYQLAFEKLGQDGSSKCNLSNTGIETDVAHVAIYRIAAQHKSLLDQFEGLGAGYVDLPVEVELQGNRVACFSYFAQAGYIVENHRPYHWYKDLVLRGAQHLQFPDDYLADIQSVESMLDNDLERSRSHQALIERMSAYQ